MPPKLFFALLLAAFLASTSIFAYDPETQDLAQAIYQKPEDLKLRLIFAEQNFSRGALNPTTWDPSRLLVSDLDPQTLNQALTLSFKSMILLGEYKKLQLFYQNLTAKDIFRILSDEGLKYLALAHKLSFDRKRYFERLEQLIEHYPISSESRWAMDFYQRDFCGPSLCRPLRLDLLKRLSRNSIVDPGLKIWLGQIIHFPQRRAALGPAILFQEEKRIEALLFLRLYQQVISETKGLLAEPLANMKAPQLYRYKGEAESALGHTDEALSSLSRAIELSPRPTQGLLEAYASILHKTQNFSLAVQIYEQLSSGLKYPLYKWHQIWNLYREGEHQSSLSHIEQWQKRAGTRLKKEMSPQIVQYWQGHMQSHLGQKSEAIKSWLSAFRHKASGLYSSLSLDHLKPLKIQDAIKYDNLSSKVVEENLFWQDIKDLSQAQGIDPYLVSSIIKSESRFKVSAKSEVGAHGLMQLMPYTAIKIANRIGEDQFQLSALLNPLTNLRYGIIYLNILRDYYHGQIPLIIAAYNAGPQATNIWLKSCQSCKVDEFIEGISYNETRKYLREVLSTYVQFKGKDVLGERVLDHGYKLNDPTIF